MNTLIEKFSKAERAKRRKKCANPKGFTMKQFCKNQKTRSKKGERKTEDLELEERCQKGYKTHPKRMCDVPIMYDENNREFGSVLVSDMYAVKRDNVWIPIDHGNK